MQRLYQRSVKSIRQQSQLFVGWIEVGAKIIYSKSGVGFHPSTQPTIDFYFN